ncbi:hypothetical protein XcodCFBP4690_20215 [Xanthomonas codiaei]|uniref:Uncharacterized protein n=1 Tax=Xanthomonas codiaei TaxID=56463 RepID=A0A2S7CA08_9XANT|nr:hypothetical protein XcodCFBP4690_20215 [Xanthomonas codiaei]
MERRLRTDAGGRHGSCLRDAVLTTTAAVAVMIVSVRAVRTQDAADSMRQVAQPLRLGQCRR